MEKAKAEKTELHNKTEIFLLYYGERLQQEQTIKLRKHYLKTVRLVNICRE